MTSLGKPERVREAAVWLLAAALSAGTAGMAFAQSPTPAGAAIAVQPAPEPPLPLAPAASGAPAASTAAAGAPGQPAASASAFPPQPSPPAKRGLLNDIGRWWTDSFSALNTKIDDFHKKSKDAATATQEAVKNAASATASATKDAATAIVRLPATRVYEVHERCVVAANGAPDCQAAATSACRAKGFNSGQPLDIRSSQACPPAVMLSGRTPVEGECPDETVILRTLCQ